MKEKWENFKASLTDITMMSKREFLLTMSVCILWGIVFGMLFSPKKTVVIGSHNGNNSGNGNKGNGVNGKDEIVDWEEVEQKETGEDA